MTEKVWEPDPTTSSDPGKYSSSVFGRRAHDLGTGDDGHRPSHTQAVVHDSGEKSLGMDSVQTHFAVREDCIHQYLGAQFLRDLGDCCRTSVDGGHAQIAVLSDRDQYSDSCNNSMWSGEEEEGGPAAGRRAPGRQEIHLAGR